MQMKLLGMVLFLLALSGCNMAKPESPQQITATCNTIAQGERTDPGLACYHSERSLPTAIQFGDSVSLGYSVIARHDLCGVVDYRHDPWSSGDVDLCGETFDPYDDGLALVAATNNGDSAGLLSDMESQLNGKHFNVLLFNSGYHDIEHGIPESVYRNNLEAMSQLCEQSADICIWVQTPGLDAPSLPLAGTTIDAESVSRYNAIARSVAREHKFYILNLSDKHHDGTVHFDSLGYWNAGAAVAACVNTVLAAEFTVDCHK